MADVTNQNKPAPQAVVTKPASPGGTKPAVLRLAVQTASGSGATQTAASKAAMRSVDAGAERQAPDIYTPKEQNKFEGDIANKTKEQMEASKTARLHQNGELFRGAVKAQAKVALALMKDMLPAELLQALKEQSGGKNDPQAVFEKGSSNPEVIESYAQHVISPLLSEKVKKAKEEGDEEMVASLEGVEAQLDPLLEIFGLGEGVNKTKHIQFLGHIAELSERGELSPEVASLVEEMHTAYEDFTDSENRFTGIYSKISKGFLSVSRDIADKGDRQARNLLKRLTGAALTDMAANGQKLDVNDDTALSFAVPFEPDLLNAPGLADVTRRLLPPALAQAMQRIYVGTLTPEQPFASLVMRDTDDRWIPNDSSV